MRNDQPAPPLCPHCREPMKLERTISHVGGIGEILVFYCAQCQHAETKVEQQEAA